MWTSDIQKPNNPGVTQHVLFEQLQQGRFTRPRASLLKWIGSKYRMAEEITGFFPREYDRVHDVFLGSGSVLATAAPARGVGADAFGPLIELWQTLRDEPETVKAWYAVRWEQMASGDRVEGYEQVKASYNASPNAADFLFLTRSCYAGVIRFRKADGYMSTPCGPHNPISPDAFAQRVNEWHRRIQGCTFVHCDFAQAMEDARPSDIVYCDPPYTHSQSILYGAQAFSLSRLLDSITQCKDRGVFVALSIDGTKRSGNTLCDLPIPDGLFEREVFIDVGRSMLKRLQMDGQTLEKERVADRLLLTY